MISELITRGSLSHSCVKITTSPIRPQVLIISSHVTPLCYFSLFGVSNNLTSFEIRHKTTFRGYNSSHMSHKATVCLASLKHLMIRCVSLARDTVIREYMVYV